MNRFCANALGCAGQIASSTPPWEPAAASADSSPTRARTSKHLLELASELQPAPARARSPRLGARGVPRAERQRRARPRGGVPRLRGCATLERQNRPPYLLAAGPWRERTADRQDRPGQGLLSARRSGRDRQTRKHRRTQHSSRSAGRAAANLSPALARSCCRVWRAGREDSRPSGRREERAPAPRPEDAPLIALGDAAAGARARGRAPRQLLAARADLSGDRRGLAAVADDADLRLCAVAARARRRRSAGSLDGRSARSVADRRCGVERGSLETGQPEDGCQRRAAMDLVSREHACNIEMTMKPTMPPITLS